MMVSAVVLTLLVAAASAAADEPLPPHEAGIDLGGYTAGHRASRTFVLTPRLGAEYRWTPSAAVRARWGLVRLDQHGDTASRSTTRTGNALLSAHWLRDEGNAHIEVGLGLTLPLASVPSGPQARLARSAYAFAAGIRGLDSLWLWAPNRMAVVAPLSLDWVTPHYLITRFEGAAAALLPAGSGASGGNDVVLELAAEARHAAPIGTGLRLQATIIPTRHRDRTQIEAAPLVEMVAGAVRIRAEMAIPLGDPLGAFRLWCFTLGSSVRF